MSGGENFLSDPNSGFFSIWSWTVIENSLSKHLIFLDITMGCNSALATYTSHLSNNALDKGNYRIKIGEWQGNIFLVIGKRHQCNIQEHIRKVPIPGFVQHHMHFQWGAIAPSKIRHIPVIPLQCNSSTINICWDAPVRYVLPIIR